jgi:hypothetical protein
MATPSRRVRATEDAVLNVQDMAALDELGAGTWFLHPVFCDGQNGLPRGKLT